MSVNLHVNRDKVRIVETLANVCNEDHCESYVVEASVHHDFHLSTEDMQSPKAGINDSSCMFSTQKLNKLKLMQQRSCHFNEVWSLFIINWKLW